MNKPSSLLIMMSILVVLIIIGLVSNNSNLSRALVGNAQEDSPGEDSDHDGIPDQRDNCPYLSNLDQQNQDGDIYGDSCDRCSALAQDDNFDSDRDGIGDVCDNCPEIFNKGQTDRDADQIGDACDSIDETAILVATTSPSPLAQNFCHYITAQGRQVPDATQNRYDPTLQGVVTQEGVFQNTCTHPTTSLPLAVDWRNIGKQRDVRAINYFCSNNKQNPDARNAVRSGGVDQFMYSQEVECSQRLGCNARTGRCCEPIRAENIRCEGTVFKNETYTTCGSTAVTIISDCATMGQTCNAKWNRPGFGQGCMPLEE